MNTTVSHIQSKLALERNKPGVCLIVEVKSREYRGPALAL